MYLYVYEGEVLPDFGLPGELCFVSRCYLVTPVKGPSSATEKQYMMM